MAYQLFVGYLKPKVLLDCKNFGAIIKRFTNTNPNWPITGGGRDSYLSEEYLSVNEYNKHRWDLGSSINNSHKD